MNIALEATLAKIADRRNKGHHSKACPANGKEASRQAAKASDRRHGIRNNGWGKASDHGNSAAEQQRRWRKLGRCQTDVSIVGE